MGFRTGAYATIWGDVESVSETMSKGRISISHKNKETDEYVQDFGGFVCFFGTAAASKALKLSDKDRIKLGDIDVTTKYDKDKKVTYTTFAIYSFEDANAPKDQPQVTEKKRDSVEEKIDSVDSPEDLPF